MYYKFNAIFLIVLEAQLFSSNANPDDIPLPAGLMAPNAALTPYVPPPVPPQFYPTMKAGILKKNTHSKTKKHKYPPGLFYFFY